MASKPIDDVHHVVRHVPNRLLQREGEKIVGCFPQSFELRGATSERKAEKYLSCSWLEYFDGDKINQLLLTINEMREYRRIKSRDAFAVANAGKIREAGRERDQKLRVLHEPAPPTYNAYAAIRGMKRDDTQLLELLTSMAVVEITEIALLENLLSSSASP